MPTIIIARRTLQARSETILALLHHKPIGTRWAVLTQPRLMPLETAATDVSLQSTPPGCACCVGNVPFRVALTRLMRDARPDGLVVELGALDHREQVERMFADPWFSKAIKLVATIDDERTRDPAALARQLSGRAA